MDTLVPLYIFFKFATDNQTINPLWLKITILPTKTNPL